MGAAQVTERDRPASNRAPVPLAILLAAAGALGIAAPAAAYVPSGLDGAERYLAYKVRVERGEAWYFMNWYLTRAAQVRSTEIADCHATRGWGSWCHDLDAVWDIGYGCTAGEILAWTSYDDPADAVRFAIDAWHESPGHAPLLHNDSGGWDRYGVGVAYVRGNHYLAVLVGAC